MTLDEEFEYFDASIKQNKVIDEETGEEEMIRHFDENMEEE